MRFEELEKRCKRYWRRRWLMPLALLVVLGGGGVWLWQEYWSLSSSHLLEKDFTQSSSSSSLAKSSSSQSSSSQSSSSSSKNVRRCFGVQLFYGYDRFIDKIYAYKKRVEKLGFHCHIKRGKLLQSGDRQLFLVCDTARSKKELAPAIQRAKESGLDYQIVYDDCRYVRKEKGSPKVKRAPKVSDKEERVRQRLIEAKSLTLQELEERFLQRRSASLALQIAKLYYRQKSYRQALVWAKRANRLDRENEDAWILYAQALKELGKLKEAKKVLRIFLEYKESKRAQELLREWR